MEETGVNDFSVWWRESHVRKLDSVEKLIPFLIHAGNFAQQGKLLSLEMSPVSRFLPRRKRDLSGP